MFKYALMGFGISVVCLVIPVVHFVTGPLAPLIGGWVAGSSAKAPPEMAFGIGVIMGGLMAVPALALPIIGAAAPDLIPIDEGWLLLIALGVPMYTVLLGTIGVLIGGRMSKAEPS